LPLLKFQPSYVVITKCSLTRNKKSLHIPAQEPTVLPSQTPHFDGLQVTSDYTVSITQVTTQEYGNTLTHRGGRYKLQEAGFPASAHTDLKHFAFTPLYHHGTRHCWLHQVMTSVCPIVLTADVTC